MKNEIHDFNADLDNSTKNYDKAITKLNKYFKTKFNKSELELDKMGSDINDGVIHIDIKDNTIGKNPYSSKNIIIEFDGWTCDKTNITDYIYWLCTDIDLLIDYKKLRDFCIEKEEMLKRVGDKRYMNNVKDGRKYTVPIYVMPMWIFNDCIVARTKQKGA